MPMCCDGAAAALGSSAAVEQVCFFNSGSDATAMALRAARAHTGKPKLGIFDGAYHGEFTMEVWWLVLFSATWW